jgi:hypothetical protein
MCPYWPLLASPARLLPICRSKFGLIATVLLNDSPELEEMNPRFPDWIDSRLAKVASSGFSLRAVAMMPRFRVNCARMDQRSGFPAQSGCFEDVPDPIWGAIVAGVSGFMPAIQYRMTNAWFWRIHLIPEWP